MGNIIIYVLLIFFFILFLTGSVYAITGSIGNARMILKAETGDTIEKYILVKNVNDVQINIVLSSSGDLSDGIKIKDEKFTLGPGEEKKAYFTIKVTKEGTTESKIDVRFSPLDGKNGVGLSSTIIIIAEKGTGWFDWKNGDNPDNNSSILPITNNLKKINPIFIALSATLLIFLIFIFLIIIYYSNNKKKFENIKKDGEKGGDEIKVKKSVKGI